MKLNTRKKMSNHKAKAKVNKEDAIDQVRKVLQDSGIPKQVVDQWMSDPRAAVENQKTEILIAIKDKIIDLSNLVNLQQLKIIELEKRITELDARVWRTESR